MKKERKTNMNPTKLLTIALCLVACLATTTVFAADDDFGIVSATPIVIADPVNPQPGMLFNAYDYEKYMEAPQQLKESHTTLPKMAAKKTGVDKSEKFGFDIRNGVKAKGIRWEGFLKCKRAATYTFLFQKKELSFLKNGYSVKINGQTVMPANFGEDACDVNLKVGWNKVELFFFKFLRRNTSRKTLNCFILK